jgi:hypothetical protein
LALAVLVLPLAGISIERAPILAPLSTELVPLGTSLQSPPNIHHAQTSFLVPARPVLRPLPLAVFQPNADNGRLHNLTSFGFLDSHWLDIRTGRSPPSD